MRAAFMYKSPSSQTKAQRGSDILILPTDDERLKIVIIPMDTLVQAPEEGSLPF